ncbi:MAG: phospho-sugar mutase [Treponema sp.]|nr:phospho-sugar mutase [Treponema sp.]
MNKNEIISRAEKYATEEQNEFFRNEIKKLIAENNFTELEDRFYRNLEFGTGGMRGIIGGGTNRINTYVIKNATQGLANYFIKTFPEKAAKNELSAVIAYDSRHYSDVFAEATACIFAANGFKTYLFSSLRPTPELSFAIRELGCDTGVVVTASHNPPQYNGYKAYWNDGAQVIEPHDAGIINEVNKVDSIKIMSPAEAISCGKLIMIDDEIDNKYQAMVKSKLFRPELIREKAKEVKIIYTPLHGTGALHVESILGDMGLNVITVPEQREGNGDFPTVDKPNPEEAEALKMAIELGEIENADVVMATDPDSDRFGIAVPNKEGKFVLVSGNQIGVLLTDYIIFSRNELNIMPKNPAIIRSIVTSTMSDKICEKHNVRLVECLTGFKWIASEMAKFEQTGSNTYIFGFEESYGYNIENEVRDKDGISAAALCAEMTLFWRAKGKTLLERINELYCEYGYFDDRTISKTFLGASGVETMNNIMSKLRNEGLKTLAGYKVEKIRDIGTSTIFNPKNPKEKTIISFPKSNVLQFFLENGTIVSARPSGTEPKIKFYINATTPVINGNVKDASKKSNTLCDAITTEINAILDVTK